MRRAIISGEFSPNQRLVEADLGSLYKTNRAVIRAVIAILTSEGLIEQIPNKGARVRLVGLDEAIEITEIRLAAEAVCAGKVAEGGTEDELQELSGLVDSMESAVEASDIMGYHSLVRQVHDRICRYSRHSIGVRVAEQMRNQSIRHVLRAAMVPGRLRSSYEEHRAIVSAIVARDPAATELAVYQHRLGAVRALEAVRVLPVTEL